MDLPLFFCGSFIPLVAHPAHRITGTLHDILRPSCAYYLLHGCAICEGLYKKTLKKALFR